MLQRFFVVCAILCAALFANLSGAEEVGSVDTKFNLLGPDHKIKIDAFDDEKVTGVACYVSRAVTGGLKGAVGLAEDTSDASIACRQIDPISFTDTLEEGEAGVQRAPLVSFQKVTSGPFLR